jgi:predicted DNA-binding transcriptional regulator YafY|tara:strand:+ start:2310 stop:2711 length:402 start_codon:yes stop_codon:yes gene_type:complete
MELFESLIQLVTEQVSNSVIKDAITNKHTCELRYLDDEKLPDGGSARVIQPVAYGYSKKNNPVIRAYQTSGPSLKVNEKGVPLPDWRLFRVDRMKSIKPMKGDGTLFLTFEEPPLYNPMNDNSMNRMVYNSKF